MVIDPTFPINDICLFFGWVQKWRSIFAQKHIPSILFKSIYPANLTRCAIVGVSPYALVPFCLAYRFAEVIMDIDHVRQRD